MGWGDDLHDLVWGTRCAGCGRPGRQLCRRCDRLLATSAPVRRVLTGPVADLTCTSGAPYDDLLERLVPAWKNDGRTGLTAPLASRLAVALNDALGEATTADATEVWLVPVPSRPESLVRRGFSPPLVLARTLARRRSRGHRLVAAGAVVAMGGTAEQVGLGRTDRRRNLAGTLRPGDRFLLARLRSARRGGAPVFLVDDVVTTGATLAETARVLFRAGVTVSGAVLVADTPAGRGGGHRRGDRLTRP